MYFGELVGKLHLQLEWRLTGSLCVYRGILSCYISSLIFGSFIPDRAVPATNLVVCNKVHPYSFPAFSREVCEHMCKARTLLY